MRILVTGSSGLVGSALLPALQAAGHETTRLVRPPREPAPGFAVWDPAAGTLDPEAVAGHDAVINLAGENIAGGRWTKARKERIRDSRVKGTRLLAETLAGMDAPPKTLISASAIGYYGDRAGELLREFHEPGEGFLPEVCVEWEQATEPARKAGVRVVLARIGIVLSTEGGALEKMLTPFKLGVGGRIGGGWQYMSWIHLDDIVGAMLHILDTPVLEGPVNLVAPDALDNRDFTKTLGRVLRRPTIFPLPGFVAKLMFGEMAEELLLGSTRVDPERLKQTRYRFRFPRLEGALKDLLKR